MKNTFNFAEYLNNPDNEENKQENIKIENKIPEINNFYKLYKDISEDFSCDISIDGAYISNAIARILIDSPKWKLVFDGTIKNNKVIIPINKLDILNEGDTGEIKLEIIVDNTVFTPWQDKYQINISKKVVALNDPIKKATDPKIVVNVLKK